MLRVAAGLYKGRVLRGGSDAQIRPTMSRVKLSFFDAIQERIREKIFLDGYAGSGSMGIEALSRGAEYVIFIDQLSEAVRTIRHNVAKIGVASDHFRIIGGDFNRSVIALAKESFRFDIIYLDPPHSLLQVANPLKVIYKRNILNSGGMVVLERPDDSRFHSDFFRLLRSQRVGRECLDFYTYGDDSREGNHEEYDRGQSSGEINVGDKEKNEQGQ